MCSRLLLPMISRRFLVPFTPLRRACDKVVHAMLNLPTSRPPMRRGATRPETLPQAAGPGFSPPRRRRTELGLFLRRWLANPLRMGAIAPSAPALARAMARAAQMHGGNGDLMVELGPGTGSVTRALLATGVSEERLVLVERDRHLHAWLDGHFPRATVLHSDARRLDEILPAEQAGRVSTVVSSLPLNSLPRAECVDIVRAAFRVLSDDGCLVQYSYGVTSPLPCETLGLSGRRVEFAAANLPPATVWCFSRTFG